MEKGNEKATSFNPKENQNPQVTFLKNFRLIRGSFFVRTDRAHSVISFRTLLIEISSYKMDHASGIHFTSQYLKESKNDLITQTEFNCMNTYLCNFFTPVIE